MSSRTRVGSPGPPEPLCPAKRQSSVQKVKEILRMTNPWQHSIKITRDVFSPHGINIRLMFAPDVLWIGGVVWGGHRHTKREFRYSACDDMVKVIGNCSDCNRFVPMRQQPSACCWLL